MELEQHRRPDREPAQTSADAQLAALGPGLTPALVTEATERAITQRNAVSALAPVWFEGSTLNAAAVASLMELLIPHGWTRGEEKGFCTAVSPDGTTRIAVATGDSRTGTREPRVMPKTRNGRGAVTERAIVANTTPTLFEDAAQHGGAIELPRVVTWILLVAVVRRELRMEVSRPQGLDKFGRISDWTERIVLDAIPADSTIDMVAEDGEEDDDMDIDIDIERREE